MRHGSLFSGIGGFDLAAQWMGWENVFHCEWNPFGQRNLKYYWPNAISHEDITKTDFRQYYGSIDIVSGGFPCQPYSTAGKRLGKDDERHLWPEMCRAIREIAPRWVVGENVRGLVNWNDGLVFDEVQADLEAQGYEVLPFLLPASGVGAPHRRDRIWFIAHAENYGREFRANGNTWDTRELYKSEQRQHKTDGCEFIRYNRPTADTQSFGIQGNWPFGQQESPAQIGQGLPGRNDAGDFWQEWPTQPPICGGDDGISRELDGITFSKWRNESIKSYGNAVVPQVVLQIFRAIQQYENNNNSNQI